MSCHTMLARWTAAAALGALIAVPPVSLSAPADGGHAGVLVIAGGSVRSGNEALYGAFVAAMPEGGDATVAVISAASRSPVATAQRFADVLAAYGVPKERVTSVRLAICDDESTPETDERDWSGNANDPAEVAKIRKAGAIWISGGDQSRLTDLLFDEDGDPTPMLAALRERLVEGAVLGGTSAGAAVMSDPMITGGDSMAALLNTEAAGERLTSSRGLGFFEPGLVDQHFDQRARLGRLAVMLQRFEPARRLGFGVDENTALVYRHARNSITVVGTGSVTVVDARDATWGSSPAGVSIRNLRVSVLSSGDALDLGNGAFTPAADLRPTVGDEYYERPAVPGGGITTAYNGLADLIGAGLLDNRGATRLERYGFFVEGSRPPVEPVDAGLPGAGVLFRFSQDEQSEGYWGYGAEGASRYSVHNVRIDIEPVSLVLRPAPGTERGRQPGSSSR